MQDDTPTIPESSYSFGETPAYVAPSRRRGSGGAVLLAVVLAFAAGAGLVTYLAWHGELARYVPVRAASVQPDADGTSGDAAQADQSAALASAPADASRAVTGLESRLAMLEDRFSRLDFEASAASGNAARAEGLLIAFAARRTIERGGQLGFIADQLKLRFADAQPRAVETITEFARNPVTIDELSARLEALTPDLTDTSQDLSLWTRTRQELAKLFTVHSDSPTLLAPSARIDRARMMLTARRIDNAIDEVERLPGADSAQKWIADARRFEETQRALDLIETTAMLEPRRLKDGSGQEVAQPSPLSTPEPDPAASPTATPTAAPSAATVTVPAT